MRAHAASASPRFFYGWIMVLFAALTLAVGVGQSYLNGILIVNFRERFEVSNQEIFLTTTGIMMVSYGLSSVLFGILVAKIGLALFAAIIFAAMALGYVALGMVTEIWEVGAVYALLFGVGQMGLPVAQTMVGRWFTAKQGLAFGVATCGLAMPGLLVAPLMTYSIGRFGFTPTMIAYGVLIACLIPLALRFIVSWPEDKGLTPDGLPASTPSTEPPAKPDTRSLIRSPQFWLVGLIVTIAPLIVTQLMTYLVPMALAAEVDMQAASFFLSGLAVCSVLSKLMVGWLADRIPLKLLTIIPLAGYVMACLLFMQHGSPVAFGMAALITGASGGASAVMIAYVIGQTFGRGAFAAVAGLTTPIVVVLSLTATGITGYLVDLEGHFQTALVGFIGLAVAGAILSLFLRPAASAR